MTGQKLSAPSWDRIIFTGFRGTGKSAVGRKIAGLTGFIFIDTDDTLEEALGCSVCDYVQRAGWPAFREEERRLLVRLAGVRQAVIATGGGAIMHQAEWRELRENSRVIWLRATAATIRHRLEDVIGGKGVLLNGLCNVDARAFCEERGKRLHLLAVERWQARVVVISQEQEVLYEPVGNLGVRPDPVAQPAVCQVSLKWRAEPVARFIPRKAVGLLDGKFLQAGFLLVFFQPHPFVQSIFCLH